MYRNYKLYYGESYAYFTADANYPTDNFGKIIRLKSESLPLSEWFPRFFDPSFSENVLFISPAPGEVFCNLMENVQVIVAGGGLVFNPAGEMLFIHRKGKWDMPKGKIELKEDISSGALREVEEETGAKVKLTNPKAVITYHTYLFTGKPTLKETHWFRMESDSPASSLLPQNEEDITEVAWKNKSDYLKIRNDCYRMIKDLADDMFSVNG